MTQRQGMTASSGIRGPVEETRLAEEQLEDRWMDSLWFELERQLGKTRTEINGVADTSQNPTKDYAKVRAVCYSPPPIVTGMPDQMATAIGDSSGVALLDYAQLGAQAAGMSPETASRIGMDQGAQPMPSDLAWLLGLGMFYWVVCNEVGIFVNRADGKLIMKRVRSSLMRGMGDPVDPGTPILLGWNRPVTITGPNNSEQVVNDAWDIWDIRDKANPKYSIVRGPSWDDAGNYSGGTDITDKVLETEALAGKAYTWRWTQGDRAGDPYIPINIYHAGYPEQLFDRYSGSGLTQGTLNTGVLQSFLLHIARDCSWPDRNVRGLTLASANAKEHDSPLDVPNDPMAIKVWEDENPEKPGQFHQWEPGADAESFAKFVRSNRQLLDEQSVPADISSVGGDPLTHRIESLRREVEKFYPVCRRYDSRTLEMIAATFNVTDGADYPESGYGLLYRTEIDDLRQLLDKIAEAMPTPEPTTEDAPNV